MHLVGSPSSAGSHGLGYDVEHAGGEAVVALTGELDLATAPALADVIAGLHEPGTDTVVLDVAALDFCDSSGLSMLVRSRRAAEARGVTLVLRSPTPALRSLLEITRLQHLIESSRSDRRPSTHVAGRREWSA